MSKVVKVAFRLLTSETKSSSDDKSTLERACSTRFQPRSALFVYCNRFDNELKVRFPLISLRTLQCDCLRLLFLDLLYGRAGGTGLCLCSYDTSCERFTGRCSPLASLIT